MEREPNLEEIMPDVEPKTRREFLRQGLMLGLTGSALVSFLAACGATATPAAPAPPTATAAPIPTAALAQPTAAATTAATSATTAAAQPTTAAAQPTTAAATAAKKGGTLTVAGHQEVPTLSPDKAVGDVPGVIIIQLFNALYEIDENYVLQPALAESVDISKDGLTYTFKLRKGVKWHDGEEFDSTDVKYNFDFYGNPANASTTLTDYKDVASVEIPDKYTAVVKLKQPNATFMALTATNFLVPEHYHKQVGEKAFETKPIGTGPFKLKEWKPAEYTLLEAFDGHFRGRPNVDFFRQDIVPETSVRAIALKTGKADTLTWPALPEDEIALSKDSNYTTFKTSTAGVNHFPLNTAKPVLSDKKVRQAMMFGLNRQRQIDDIRKGAGTLATSNLPPTFKFWYEPNVAKYEYSPDKAKALLDEAGWKAGADGIRVKDNVKLSFTITTITGDQARRPQAEMLQQDFKAIGIDVQLKEQPVSAIQAEFRKGKDGNVDASLYNWTYCDTSGDPDAYGTLRSDGTSNWSNFKNARVDDLLDNGRKETDPEKRKAIYSEIQKIVADEVPFLYVQYWDLFQIYSKRVKGLPATAAQGYNIIKKAYQFWLEDAK